MYSPYHDAFPSMGLSTGRPVDLPIAELHASSLFSVCLVMKKDISPPQFATGQGCVVLYCTFLTVSRG